MAGLAKTSKFMLSTATVMVGPPADVFELTPANHSIGLVKNVQVNTEPTFVELMQGVNNQLVYSVNTEMPVTVSCEVYEYTARNLAYAAQLDASGVGFDNDTTVAFPITTQLTDASTAIALGGTDTMPAAGDWLVLQDGTSDLICVVVAGTVTSRSIAIASGSLPTGVTWPVATTKVYKVKNIPIGSTDTPNFFGVKIVGKFPEKSEPITMVFPKVRITRGLSLSFVNDNFANMPFEFKPFALLPTDTQYANFTGNVTGRIFTR